MLVRTTKYHKFSILLAPIEVQNRFVEAVT